MRTLLLAAGVLLICDSAAIPTEPLTGLEKVASAYKIKIQSADPEFPVKTQHGKIDGKAASEAELAKYTPLFIIEFSLYPPELVKKTKLERVVFCVDLSFAGQKRTAIPDFEHNTLYLDVARGMPNTTYLRKVLHHEFFHIIDLRDDGTLTEDEGWAKENPAEFKYGTGGINAQDNSKTSVPNEDVPGFLNHYSTTAIEEDKAEVFAHLVVDPNYYAERAKKDEVLSRKAKRMKKLIADFCTEADGKFWESASQARRGI